MWFKMTLTAPVGGPGLNSAVYWGVYPHTAGVQSLLINQNNAPLPGTPVTYGPYELVDTSTWQTMFAQERSTNSADYPSVTWTQTVSYSSTSSGTYTTLCSVTGTGLTGGGWSQLLPCDLRSVFGPPPPPCAYGTRSKATSPLTAVLEEGFLVALADGLGLTWLETMILVAAGQQIDVNGLCQAVPPTPPPPTPEALNYPPYKVLQWVYPLVWNTFCECVPGSPTPTPFPPYNPTKPGGWQDPRVIVVNPTNPCLDLTEVRRMLDTVIRQLNVDVQIDTLMQRYSLPFATILGAAHSGLTGTGSFAISRLIGVQIVITDRGPNRELEGAPNYVWDLGWISCMDGNGFIQERRITRDVEVWMPREFQEATTLGYVFKDGVTARIVELEAEV